MKKKRLICFVLFGVILTGLFSSCTGGDTGIRVVLGGNTYEVNAYNKALKNQQNVLYDRNYKKDDGFSITIRGKDGYSLVKVYTDQNGDCTEIEITTSSEQEVYIIPTNGFLFFLKDKVEENAEFGSVKGLERPDYIDLAGPAFVSSDQKNGVAIDYKDCEGFPSEDINILMQPKTSFTVSEIPKGFFSISVKRNLDGSFEVIEADVKKYDSKLFTLVFGDAYSKAFAKKVFTKGSKMNILNSDKVTEFGRKDILKVDDKSYPINNVNSSESKDSGIYLYDNDYTELVTPDCKTEFVDLAVISGVVVWIGELNENAVIPVKSGYIVRFVGEQADKAKSILLGSRIDTVIYEEKYSPLNYVKINDQIIEIGYINQELTFNNSVALYNSDFYSLKVRKENGFNIAVSNGKVVEAKFSSGVITVPQDGYLLCLGNSNNANRLSNKIKVGDKAEIINESSLYSVKKIGITGVNVEREEWNSLVCYNSEYGSSTKTEKNGIEVLVDKNGYVDTIYDTGTGNAKIPDDQSFIISVNGDLRNELLANIKKGSYVFFNDKNKALYITQTPDSLLQSIKIKAEEMQSNYDFAKEELYNVNYDKAKEAIEKVNSLITALEQAKQDNDYANYANKLFEAEVICEDMEYAFVPSLRVQNREAWVTVAEEAANGNMLVHVDSEEDVIKYIDYAKKLRLNTVIVDAFASTFSLYNSDVNGIIPLAELNGFDVVEAFVRNGKEQGIKVNVLVCAFSGGSSAITYPEDHYSNIYRDKVLVTNNGRDTDATNNYNLNPFDEDVKKFQLAIFEELINKYDIDGLQIDYIRFPLPIYYQAHNYEDFGYNTDIRTAFKAKYGIDPINLSINDSEWDTWCEFRRDIITSFVESIYKKVKSLNNDITLSFTCFADYNDRQIYVYQDVEKWCANGWVDTLYPMIYADDTYTQYSYAQPLSESIEANAHIVFGIGTFVYASKESVNEQSYMSYELSSDGIAIFTIRYTGLFNYFDSLKDGSFRDEAVCTDQGKDAFLVGADEIISNIENVYLRFYENQSENLNSIKNLLLELKTSAKSYTDDKNFNRIIAKELLEVKSKINLSDNKLSNKLYSDFDYLINCFTRSANVAERNKQFD